MSAFWLTITALLLAMFGAVAARARAIKSASGDMRRLHSLPKYYSGFVGVAVIIPALGLLVLWLFAQPMLIERTVQGTLSESAITKDRSVSLVMSEVRRVSAGLSIAVEQGILSHAQQKARSTTSAQCLRMWV